VVIVATEQLNQVLRELTAANKKVALLHCQPVATEVWASIRLSGHPAEYAHELYASLRTLDDEKADVIVVQAVPDTAQWHGVHDRLRRAAHDSLGVLNKLLG